MTDRRVVYSTGAGRVCAGCGWLEPDCQCSPKRRAAEESVPAKPTAKLRVENRASGKVVTVVDGLPANSAFLEGLARELKKACGTGGRAGEGLVEVQGDQRERVRELLGRKGWSVKG